MPNVFAYTWAASKNNFAHLAGFRREYMKLFMDASLGRLLRGLSVLCFCNDNSAGVDVPVRKAAEAI